MTRMMELRDQGLDLGRHADIYLISANPHPIPPRPSPGGRCCGRTQPVGCRSYLTLQQEPKSFSTRIDSGRPWLKSFGSMTRSLVIPYTAPSTKNDQIPVKSQPQFSSSCSQYGLGSLPAQLPLIVAVAKPVHSFDLGSQSPCVTNYFVGK